MNSFPKILGVFLLFASLTVNLVSAQTLPILNLKKSIIPGAQIKSPIPLGKDEICVTVVLGGGMTAHDYYNHYIFRRNGDVLAIREELPKSYLKNKNLLSKRDTIILDESEKLKWVRILNSKIT